MMIVERAALAPGSCYVTGRSDGPLIDTGFDIDDRPNYGRVYLAASFISDAIGMLGGLGAADAQRLRDGIAQRDSRIAELEQALEGLTAANEALVKAGYSPKALAPVDDLSYELLSDDDLIDAAVDAELELPANASRSDIIAALVNQ